MYCVGRKAMTTIKISEGMYLLEEGWMSMLTTSCIHIKVNVLEICYFYLEI